MPVCLQQGLDEYVLGILAVAAYTDHLAIDRILVLVSKCLKVHGNIVAAL
jgi:hypothetical protein